MADQYLAVAIKRLWVESRWDGPTMEMWVVLEPDGRASRVMFKLQDVATALAKLGPLLGGLGGGPAAQGGLVDLQRTMESLSIQVILFAPVDGAKKPLLGVRPRDWDFQKETVVGQL